MQEKIIIIMRKQKNYSISRGDIIVKTQQDGKLIEYAIKEGEMFLLPAKNIPNQI